MIPCELKRKNAFTSDLLKRKKELLTPSTTKGTATGEHSEEKGEKQKSGRGKEKNKKDIPL